ncbi:MAG: O-antigen ligase family protein [Flavobacteriales bacterium]|nr:O-antigen ligase family protein [Flavobacteriales bacterium]
MGEVAASVKLKHLLIYAVALAFVVGGVVFSPLSYVTFILFAGIIIFSKDQSLTISLLFFLMPVATIFKPSVGATSFYTYIQLVFIIKQLWIHRFLPRRFFLWWALFVIYVILGMSNAVSDAIKQISIPILYYYCMQDENRKNVDSYIESYTLGVLASSVLGVIKNSIPNLTNYAGTKSNHLGSGIYLERFSGLWGDPNYYSINLMLAFACILYLYTKRKISLVRTVIYFVLIVVFGAMTRSASFILVLAATMVIMVVVLFQSHHGFIGSVSIILIIVAGYLLLSGRLSVFDSSILKLQTSIAQGDVSTGRLDRWSTYINEFIDHPLKLLIGNGVGKFFSFTIPHNTYIDFLDIYGILGTFIFLQSIASVNRPLIKKRSIVNYLPLIIILVMYFTLSMIFYLDLVYQMLLAFMVLYDASDETQETTSEEILPPNSAFWQNVKQV